MHNYDLNIIRELIETYETKERVRARGKENWAKAYNEDMKVLDIIEAMVHRNKVYFSA